MRLRVVLYNVKRFRGHWGAGRDGSSTLKDIGAALAELQPEVVCFNEVDITSCSLDDIKTSMRGGNVCFYGHVNNGRYGNAIWSKLPIEVEATVELRGGSVLEWPKGSKEEYRIVRGLLVTKIAGESSGYPSFAIYHTHLDHMQEKERLKQLTHVLEFCKGQERPHLLTGDLNALTLLDYGVHEWESIKEKHRNNGWENPRTECTELLAQSGLQDCFRAATHEAGFTASVDKPHLRIDYCFANEQFLRKFSVHRGFVAQGIKHSDHFPVVIDFVSQGKSSL